MNHVAYENSVVFVCDHLDSIELNTTVGTGYSLMKFPLTPSLTFLVTPRLIVCLRRQAVSVLAEPEEATERGLLKGSPNVLGSTLRDRGRLTCYILMTTKGELLLGRRIESTSKATGVEWQLLFFVLINFIVGVTAAKFGGEGSNAGRRSKAGVGR